jgi:Cbb3-type cytochrome oxidase, cytochrome c subunit
MSEGSVMPPYAFMLENDLDVSNTEAKINAMRKLGVPYAKGYEKQAVVDLQEQAKQISNSLISDSIRVSPKKEVIALIAYIQRLGTDIGKNKVAVLNK